MKAWNTPSGFLTIGGAVLILVGVLGFFLIGPTATDSIFGSAWWFDNAENYAHLLLGVVGLVLALGVKNAALNKWVTALLGLVGVFFGVYSIFTPGFGTANLENPADTILHLVVGAWALYAAFGGNE